MSLKMAHQLAESHEGLSVDGIRKDVSRAKENGLEQSGAIIRRGRRVLIDEALYIDWMRKRGAGQLTEQLKLTV